MTGRFELNSSVDNGIGSSGGDGERGVAKRAKPIEWTIWEAVVALNDSADLADYERLRAEETSGTASATTYRRVLQRKLNETVTGRLRRGELRAVGRLGNPNASYEELTASTWIEYVFASYPESFAAHRRDLEDRIYDVRISPREWGDALVR